MQADLQSKFLLLDGLLFEMREKLFDQNEIDDLIQYLFGLGVN